MPELPEVETLRRSLVAPLVGQSLGSLVVHRTDLREPLNEVDLGGLVGRRITGLRRRAKYLLIDCEGNSVLVVHLGMSGQLTLVEPSEPVAKHEHLSYSLGNRRLRYVDPRRFGLLFRLNVASLEEDRHFAHLGVEPLEASLTGELLQRAACNRRGPIKSFLMDSTVVVGVGNIYASEALHLAGIHPARGVHRIGPGRWNRLAESIRTTLASAIDRGGTSFSDYVDGLGNRGEHQRDINVYGRLGEACHRCDRPIRRLVQSGRSTFYCPGCQR